MQIVASIINYEGRIKYLPLCMMGGKDWVDTSARRKRYTGHVRLARAAVTQLAARRSYNPMVGNSIMSCRTLSHYLKALAVYKRTCPHRCRRASLFTIGRMPKISASIHKLQLHQPRIKRVRIGGNDVVQQPKP